ncbi:MAG TPA: cysteine peptidase family C39 domain-containing protein, partial [Candidatus Dormibacteraeota bacterium]|nr:cysteine peptidase family C39 domain-containing protein [Candidatus Dormibacteraeota bacterium]
VIKYGLFVDHYVTVLRADDQEIIVGDPARGATAYRPQDFAEQWRFTGIVLSRTNGAAPARGEMHKKDELW